jgi:hypothetical protein
MSMRGLLTLSLLTLCATTAFPAPEAAPPPAAGVGLEEMARFGHLPCLRRFRVVGFSSHDPRGGKRDRGNFLAVADGEQTLAELAGPGCVTRIWSAGHDPMGRIRVYFDAESTPRIDLPLAEFFGGRKAPFLSPLCDGSSALGGGAVCYLPLPFAQRIRIATTGNAHAYNVAIAQYPPGTPVSTWTGKEASEAVRAAWEGSGPEPAPGELRAVSTTLDLAAGAWTEVARLAGGGVIRGLRVRVPGMGDRPGGEPLTETGRAHRGSSEWAMAPDPAAEAVRLVRRFDFGISDQKVTVYVDGEKVGEWFDRGADPLDRWRDSSFALPVTATRGKSLVRIRLQHAGTGHDWTEFRYGLRCRVGGEESETDALDVGDPASEAAHGYRVATPTWLGKQTFTYPRAAAAPPLTAGALSVRITWDDEAMPAVEAPLDLFFGGSSGREPVTALPVAMEGGTGFCAFPMPFRQGARIELASRYGEPVRGVVVTLQLAPLPADWPEWGYFRTQYRAGATADGVDWTFLDAVGHGQLVGIAHDFGAFGGALEGDERFYLDDSRSPAIHGTGTDHFYNAAGQFFRGPFTRAVYGHCGHGLTGTAYRFFLPDLIPFQRSIRAGFEHGGANDVPATYRTLAFYYSLPKPAAILSDMLEVGQAESERAHDYRASEAEAVSPLSQSYEGDASSLAVIDGGRRVRGKVEMVLKLAKDNVGAILRRRLDAAVPDQEARVFVDDALAGTWLTPGQNAARRWRDDEFLLPAALTRGKERVAIRIEPAPRDPKNPWTEMAYWLYSLLPGSPPPVSPGAS